MVNSILNIKILEMYRFIIINIVLLIAVSAGSSAQEMEQSEMKSARSRLFLPRDTISIPFGKVSASKLLGSVFIVSGDEIRKYGGNDLYAALKGKIPGLRMKGNSISGRSGAPLLLIDGLPKPANTLNLQEIDEVIYLPDFVAAAKMGPLAIDGVLYVKTKRGKPGAKQIEINYQHGMDFVTKYPEFMDTYNYVKTNNQIRANDGLSAIYSESDLEAYKNQSDPVYHPNLGLRETLLNSMKNRDQVGTSLLGGFKKGDYYFYGGYESASGLEAIGEQQTENSFIFNSKVNIVVNELISLMFGVKGRYNTHRYSTYSLSNLMNAINYMPPNAFPLQLGDSIYIGSLQYRNNPLAKQQDGGYIQDVNSNIIFDAAINFDFEQYLKGLSYSTDLMVDNSSFYSEILFNQPETYWIKGQDELGNPELGLLQSEHLQLNPSNNGANVTRTYVYSGNLSYDKVVDNHNFNLDLLHYLYWKELKGTDIDQKYLFYSLNANYMFKNKYVLDATIAYNGSQKLLDDNSFKAFPTFALGWILSQEDFLKGNRLINFLKLRTSYGLRGKDPNSNYLYQTVWGQGTNSLYFGNENGGSTEFGLRQLQEGNSNVSWIDFTEFNVGADAILLDSKMSLNLNYFNRLADGYISNMSSQYSTMLGWFSAYLPNMNNNKTRYSGLESNLAYSDQISDDFSYTVVANYTYHIAKLLEGNNITYPDSYRNAEGKSTDAIWGLESDGLFTESTIGNHDKQAFGSVYKSDVKYIDQNNDGLVDDRDVKQIGNTQPRHSYSISLNLKYKNWNLFASGYGLAGYNIDLNGNRYFQINGNDNYPVKLRSLPNGNTMPRLSTIDTNNNYQTSDYWLVNGGMFRLNNLELGYSISQDLASKLYCKNIKLFVRSNNLLVISSLDDVDPEYPASGLSSYPTMKTLIIGATVRF